MKKYTIKVEKETLPDGVTYWAYASSGGYAEQIAHGKTAEEAEEAVLHAIKVQKETVKSYDIEVL